MIDGAQRGLLVAAAVVALIVAVIARSATSDTDVEVWAVAADKSYVKWAGSAEEVQAAEVAVAYALNGRFSECMSERGYSRPWQESIVPAPVSVDPLIYSFWAAGPLDDYYAQKVINGEIGQRIERALNISAKGPEEAAEVECRQEHPGASDGEVDSLRAPVAVHDLEEAWARALAPLMIAGGDIQTYDTCLAAAGVLDRLDVDSTQEARDQLSALLPVGSVSIGREPSTEAWDAYLEDERAFVEADWECRRDVRAGLASELDAETLDKFEATHASEIAAARKHWDEIVRQASKLGWTPDDPYAGAKIPPAP